MAAALPAEVLPENNLPPPVVPEIEEHVPQNDPQRPNQSFDDQFISFLSCFNYRIDFRSMGFQFLELGFINPTILIIYF